MKLQALLCVFIFILSASAAIRKIESTLNPGCPECDSTFVYVKATGEKDVLHQLWDFTNGIPTVILFLAGLNSTLNMIWRDTDLQSFDLSEKPTYSVGMAFDSIIEYDDLDDKAQFDPKYPHQYISMSKFVWQRTASLVEHEGDAMLLMHHTTDTMFTDDVPTVEFRVESSSTQLNSVSLPHLLFTPDASIIDITLSGMNTNENYKQSRFAFHFVLVCTDNSTDSFRYVEEKKLDDEHAPGVFQMTYLKTPEAYYTNSTKGGYVEFRPVAYREYKRNIASSTAVKVSTFKRVEMPHSSTVDMFFNNRSLFALNDLVVQDVSISFGDPGDGFYKQFNVTAWEFALGVDKPPAEHMSAFVLAVLGVGLSLPALLAVVALGVVLARRGPWQRLFNQE